MADKFKLRIKPRALTSRDIALADADAEISAGIASGNQAQATRGMRARKEALESVPECVCAACEESFEQGDETIVAVVSVLQKRRQPDGSITTEWVLERDLDSPISFAYCPECAEGISFLTKGE